MTGTGRGCKSDEGLGKGASSPNCSGTGAGHAGRGGVSKECPSDLQAGTSYDTRPTDTMYEGSGGGSFNNTSTGGSGGGILWLSLLNQLRINNTLINADGENG